MPAPPSGSGRVIAATLLFCAACLLLLGARRAGWLDEYWTIWHTDPANPIAVAYWSRWVYDTQHPPTFYALTWLFAPMTGTSLVARRLVVNSLGLLLAAAAWGVCRRRGASSAQPVLFALLIVSNPFFLTYFAEHRSYFLALIAAASLTATVRQFHLETAAAAPLRPLLGLWLAAITLVAVNLHYMVSMCVLVLLGCECLWQWFRGDRHRAILIAAIAMLAVLPALLALGTAFSMQKPIPVTNNSFLSAWGTIGLLAVIGIVVNPVLMIHALPSARAFIRDRGASTERYEDGRGSFLLVTIAALLLSAVALAVVHAINHNMYPRLALGLIPFGSAVLAELAAWRPLKPRTTTLACLNAILIVAVTTFYGLRNPRWEYFARDVRAAVRACPTTRVLAYNPLFLLPPDNPGWKSRGQAQAMTLGYHLIAQKYGFAVTVMPVEGPPPAADPRCPTLVWMEHNFFRDHLPAAELAERAVVSTVGKSLSLRQDGSHYLLRVQ